MEKEAPKDDYHHRHLGSCVGTKWPNVWVENLEIISRFYEPILQCIVCKAVINGFQKCNCSLTEADKSEQKETNMEKEREALEPVTPMPPTREQMQNTYPPKPIEYEWVLLRDLPWCPAGTVGKESGVTNNTYYFSESSAELYYRFDSIYMTNKKDWFERREKKPVRWVPKKGERYFFTCGEMDVVMYENGDTMTDRDIISRGITFKTKSDAELAVARIKEALRQVRAELGY